MHVKKIIMQQYYELSALKKFQASNIDLIFLEQVYNILEMLTVCLLRKSGIPNLGHVSEFGACTIFS